MAGQVSICCGSAFYMRRNAAVSKVPESLNVCAKYEHNGQRIVAPFGGPRLHRGKPYHVAIPLIVDHPIEAYPGGQTPGRPRQDIGHGEVRADPHHKALIPR